MNGVTNGVSWRRRGFSLLAASCLVVVALTPAWADDLDDQIQDGKQELEETEGDLADAEENLDQSTKELNDATQAYEDAVANLPAAEEKLAAAESTLTQANEALEVAEGELAAAKAADAKAADKLTQAEQRVQDQLARIDEVNGRIDGKRASISRVASQAYQRGTGGELATLAAALSASDLHELVTSVEATRSVVNAETVILTDLRDDRAKLANERVVLEELEAEAQDLREQAAARLKETERLERQAQTAKDEAQQAASHAADAKAEVESLISARQDAKAAAEAAKKENARQYRQLENERESIQADIDRLERERAEREREREQEENDDPPSNDGGGGNGGGDSDNGGNGGGGDSDNGGNGGGGDSDNGGNGGGGSDDDGGGGGNSSGIGWPVSNPYVTSPYGMRTHPITGVRKLHDGTDFRARCGTPIRAAASGTVEWAHYRGGYGNQVAVSHGSIVTTYSHLSRFAVGSGSHVSQGEVVGYSGTTGLSTACHLHFMLYVNGALQRANAGEPERQPL